MQDDTTEIVAEHSSRLQPLIKLHGMHAQLQPSCSAALVPMYYPEGITPKGLGKPCAVIKPYNNLLASTLDSNSNPDGRKS